MTGGDRMIRARAAQLVQAYATTRTRSRLGDGAQELVRADVAGAGGGGDDATRLDAAQAQRVEVAIGAERSLAGVLGGRKARRIQHHHAEPLAPAGGAIEKREGVFTDEIVRAGIQARKREAPLGRPQRRSRAIDREGPGGACARSGDREAAAVRKTVE